MVECYSAGSLVGGRLTYVYTQQGVCYAAFIADVYSRKILGYAVSRSQQTDFVLDALRQALSVRTRPNPHFSPVSIIHHFDAKVPVHQ